MSCSERIVDDYISETYVPNNDHMVNNYKELISQLSTKCDELELKLLELKTEVNYTKPIDVVTTENKKEIDGEKNLKRKKYEDLEEEYDDIEKSAELLSWDKLASIVNYKMNNMIEMGKPILTPKDLVSYEIFPNYMSSNKPSEDELKLLAIAPYLKDYIAMRKNLAKLISENKLQSSHNNTFGLTKSDWFLISDTVVIITPSKWVIDFFNVFNCAKTASHPNYPAYTQMDDIFFQTKKIKQIKPDYSVNEHCNIQHSYAIDLGYHFMAFAHLFTSVMFKPIKAIEDRFFPVCYTDTEFFIHFALISASNEPSYYVDFLRKPIEHFRDHRKSLYLSQQLVIAAKTLLSTFAERKYFFTCSRNTLQLKQVKEKDVVTAEIPDEILQQLKKSIFPDVRRELRKQYIYMSEISTADKNSTLYQSPLVQMLNFDNDAYKDFVNILRKTPTSAQNDIRLHPMIGFLPSLIKVYAMLLSAASALYSLNPHSPSTNLFTNKTVDIHAMDEIPKYYSTGQAFPGLFFYTMLGLKTPAHILNPNLNRASTISTDFDRQELNKGMASVVFFANRPDRTAVFQCFKAYTLYVKKLSASKDTLTLPSMENIDGIEKGIRYVMPNMTDILANNCGKDSKGTDYYIFVQASYVTIIGSSLGPVQRMSFLKKKDDDNILKYFMSAGLGKHKISDLAQDFSIDHSTDVSPFSQRFFSLPITFTADIFLVEHATIRSEENTNFTQQQQQTLAPQISTLVFNDSDHQPDECIKLLIS